MNPFLTAKKNNYPTYTIIPKQANPRKNISILPLEENTTPEEINLTEEVATSALKLETARKISVSGDATGAVLFDGTSDANIIVKVKNSERAIKDGNGKEISKTYAAKSDLNEYAKKSEVVEKLNYLESVLYATKTAVNEMQSELNTAKENISELEETVNNSSDTVSGGGNNLADDDDIDSLFGE